MQPASVLWLQQHARDVVNAGRRLRQHMEGWAFLDLADDQVRYLTEIEAGNWDQLLQAGRDVVQARTASLAAIADHETVLADLWSRRPTVVKATRRLDIPHALDDYPALRNTMEESLVATGLPADEIAEALALLDEIDPRRIPRTLETSLNQLTEKVRQAASRHHGSFMGAVLAMAVARFNLAVASDQDLADSPEDYRDTVLSDLDVRERELWRTLRAEDRFLSWSVARDLRAVAGRRLLVGAVPHAAQLARQRVATPDVSQLGVQAMEMGNLVRRLLRAVALGLALESACRWPEDAAPFRYWVRLANGAGRSTSAWRWPFRTTTANLLSTATRSEGKARTIEGRVVAVNITHRRRKAISLVTIEADGVRLDAVLPYIKADSGGLVPGSWCRLAGTWRNESADAEGPALELQRMPLRELARVGWHEAISAGLASIFTPVSHGLAAEWSWESGTDGAGNQLRYGTWL